MLEAMSYLVIQVISIRNSSLNDRVANRCTPVQLLAG